MEVDMNWAAVAAGTVAAMVSGMIWYNPNVFGTKWMKAIGLTEKKMQAKQTQGMVVAALRSFILSYAMYHIITVTAAFYNDESFLTNALGVGAWVGIAIVAVTMIMHDTFEQRPAYATKVHVGFEIVTILLVSGVIGVVAG